MAGAGYSSILHGQPVLKMYGKSLAKYSMALPGLICLPLAVLHGSTLLGYATVGCVLSLLGLHGGAGHLCIFLGFESEHAAVRTTIACAIGLVAFTAARAGAQPLVPSDELSIGCLLGDCPMTTGNHR